MESPLLQPEPSFVPEQKQARTPLTSPGKEEPGLVNMLTSVVQFKHHSARCCWNLPCPQRHFPINIPRPFGLLLLL